MDKKLRHISGAVFCIYVAAVILLCIMKTDGLPEVPEFFLGIPLDKILHFLMFLPFPILGYMTFQVKENRIWRKLTVLAVICLLGCCFAYSTERLQALTAYRSCDMSDMAADCLGMAAGILSVIIHIIVSNSR